MEDQVMIRFGVVFSLLVLLMLTVLTFSQTQSACRVEKMVVAREVVAREPVDAATQFPAGTVRVYCWTKIDCQQVPCKIKHVWFKGEEKKLEVPLSITTPAMRTWSWKTMSPGNWTVQVQDASGVVISYVDFVVE
jgi:hypothetical protein